MNNSNIRMQVLCALFAAFCAVCSQLTIPIQPVPITLGTFAVLLAGGFLGSRYGLMSMVLNCSPARQQPITRLLLGHIR